MPPAPGRSAVMGEERADVRQHLFHGAHDGGKLNGSVEVRLHPESREGYPGEKVRLTAVLVNAKAGHKIPTGSVEDRIVWLHVEATDASGQRYHLPVDPKGFEGEAYTIASGSTLAYQDIGDIKGIEGFKGLPRDGDVPDGDRIFRMPYLDPQGRMTIQQWNTKSQGADYRIGPRETKVETFTWALPDDIAPGRVQVSAQLNYQRLVQPVADFLDVPADETEIEVINLASTWFEVYD